MKFKQAGLLAAGMLFAGSAQALLLSPSSVGVNSTYDPFGSGLYKPASLIDNSGLTQPVGVSSVHVAEATQGIVWLSDRDDTTPVLTFEFAEPLEVTAADIWNYNYIEFTSEYGSRGVKTMNISYSVDGTNWLPVVDGASLECEVGYMERQRVAFPSAVTARYIRFSVLENHGDSEFTGLAEVKFDVNVGAVQMALNGLSYTYDYEPHEATVSTVPAGLPVTTTYNGSLYAPTDAGTYTVIATVDQGISGGSVTGELVIAQANQTISEFAPAGGSLPVGELTPLSAIASSGLDVTYSVVEGVAIITNGAVLAACLGDIRVEANQSGSNNFSVATPVVNTFTATSPVLAGYVDASRPDDSGDGLSWATAKKTIQAGVDTVSGGGTVWVTNGVYSVGGSVAPNHGISNRVCITKNITVRSVNGSEVTSIVGSQGDIPVRGAYLANGAYLSGFTVTGGSAEQVAVWDDSLGGGIYMTGASLFNCVVSGNVSSNYGGGVWIYDGQAANCTVSGNSSEYGGGVHADGEALVFRCSVSQNTATYGGGIFTDNGGEQVVDCTISGNSASEGGGVYAEDGGIFDRCSILNNTASDYGGGAMALYNAPRFNNCLIAENSAAYGGGFYSYEADGESNGVYNCTIVDNDATKEGGGAYVDYGAIYNSVVWDNTVAGPGNDDIYDLYPGEQVYYTCASDGITNGLNGCTDSAPTFADSGNGDFRLLAGSVGVNAGSNDYAPDGGDMDRIARIQGGTVDMGAYEVGSEPMDQTLCGVLPASGSLFAPGSSVELSAATSSELPAAFTVLSGPASVSGNTLTFSSGFGTVYVVAAQDGNADYNAAQAATNTYQVIAPAYQVTSEVHGNGTITIAENWHPLEPDLPVLASPDTGWLFMGWGGDLSGGYAAASAILVVDSQKHIVATFSDDADSDGISNADEASSGTDPRKADTDNDGSNDAEEWVAGTSPTNNSSVLALQFSRAGGTNELSWHGVNDRHYRLEYSEDLLTWQPMGAVVSGSGASVQKTDTEEAVSNRYYRVRASGNPGEL